MVYQVLQHHGLSQRVIAQLTGQSQSEIYEILTGRRVRDIALLSRIADGLNLPRAEFGLAVGGETVALEQPDGAADAGRWNCHICSSATPPPEPPGPVYPVADLQAVPASLAPTVWTGIEARMLRLSRRMSVRDFARHLGISDRMVSKWEAAGAGLKPRPHNQAILDTALDRATQEERARFTTWLAQGKREH